MSDLLGRKLLGPLLVVGVTVGLAALAAFLAVRELRPEAAQTAAYATVALAELVFVFSCRAETLPPWRLPRNRHLEVAVLGSLGFLVLTLYLPALQDVFDTVSPSLQEAAVVVSLAIVPALAAEAWKTVARRRARSGPADKLKP